MRYSTAVVFLGSAAFAAAATTTAAAAASQSTCQAEYIVQACLASETAKANACPAADWVCLCNNYQNILTCYNNCPGDAQRSTVEGQVSSYCGAAAPILSASAASVAAAKSASPAAFSASSSPTADSTDAASPAETTGATKTGSSSASKASGTASGSKASSTGAAPGFSAPVGGVLAVVLGLVGAL